MKKFEQDTIVLVKVKSEKIGNFERKNIICLDKKNLKKWRVEISPIEDDFYVYFDIFKDSIITTTHKGGIFKINPKTGKILKWKFN